VKKRLIIAATVTCLLSTTPAFAATGSTVPISSLKPAVHLSKPTLKQTGGKLILSDSPETFSSTGAFYRDTATGSFRVFWHHQNAGLKSDTVAAAITNTSNENVLVFSQGSGVATNVYPDVAGQQALTHFMKSHADKQYLATLKPGQSYFVAASTPVGDTTSGIAQFAVYEQKTHRPATVTVTTLNYQVQPVDPTKVTILKSDSHTRGSFAHFNRLGLLHYDVSQGNAYIRLSSANSGPWSDSLPGEYEAGVDVVDGNTTVYDNGNYGVTYKLVVDVANSLHQPRQLSVFDNPSGGYGHYVMRWNNQVSDSNFLSYQNAWQFAQATTGASHNMYYLETSLPGGASGPQVIYFSNTAAQ
jgi:hypothetical protein